MNKIRFHYDHILILGFGKEGRSSYRFIRSQNNSQRITIADINEGIKDEAHLKADPYLGFQLGEHYLDDLNRFDLMLRTPGINPNLLSSFHGRISSQTELFIEYYGQQCIGITGTKGKSSTAKFVHDVLRRAGKHSLLGGNIGIPVFDLIEDVTGDSIVVLELSCHQLSDIEYSPKYSIILNLFEEHLDFYDSVEAYYLSKWNIAKFQSEMDYCFINSDNEPLQVIASQNEIKSKLISSSILNPVSDTPVKLNESIISFKNGFGEIKTKDFPILHQRHILENMLIVFNLLYLLDIPLEVIKAELLAFEGLEHRLEQFGTFKGIQFVNDSISTIPQSSIAAIKSFENVSSIIVGGMDRGIDYQPLITYLSQCDVPNVICIDETGKLIFDALVQDDNFSRHIIYAEDIERAVRSVFELSPENTTCVFSPAASSYNNFKNFEERGQYFKDTVQRIGAL